MACLHQIPPLRAQGTLQRRYKDYKSLWRQETPRKQGLPDTTKLTHTWSRNCGQMHRVRCGSVLRGKRTQVSTPNSKLSLTGNHSTRKREIFSLIKISCNNMFGQSPCPAVDGQHKTNSMVFLEGFGLTMLYLSIFLTLQIFCLYMISDFVLWVCCVCECVSITNTHGCGVGVGGKVLACSITWSHSEP